jgi:hypothetical protein
MLTITVPPELAVPLADEARRRGTTPELLALEGVRSVIRTEPPAGSLLDFLGRHVGAVDGSAEPLSQNCGESFAEGLASGKPARP